MAVFWIILIIEIISYTPAGNGQCASSTNIVRVCTNSTDSYTQMYIPVNGSMADGCQCDVTLVKTASETGLNRVSVSNVEGVKECGYKVVHYNTINNDSWTCSNNEISLYQLRLNESFQLTFTSDSTLQQNSSGFCLQLNTTINNMDTNNTFTITCWRSHTTQDSTSTTLTPQTETEDKTKPTTTITTPRGEATPITTITKSQEETTPTTTITNAAIIGGGAAGACLLLIIIIVIIVCLMKRRKNNQYHKPSTRTNGDTGYEDVHPDEPIMMENNGDSQRAQGRSNSNNADEMIYLENDLYVSAGSFPDNSTPTPRSPSSPDYTDIDDFPGRKPDKAQTIPPADVSVDKNPNVNVYAVVNKKPKTEKTDGETSYYKDENQPSTFSVGQTPASNNIYAVVNKPPKNEKTDNSGEEPNHQASAHNDENPREIFSVSETPNPNNAYAVVNKKPKVTDKPSKPETPPKPGKPPKAEKAVKPRVPSKQTTKL